MKSRTALAALTAACLCMGGVATAQAQSSLSSGNGSSDDGKSPVTSTVRVTAPAVTVTPTSTTSTAPSFVPGGPSSDFIERGILDEEQKQKFEVIKALIVLGTGLLQLGGILVQVSPRFKDAIKHWMASMNIKF